MNTIKRLLSDFLKIDRNSWKFTLVPTVFLVVAILYIYCIELFFLRCTDPDYAYLFNGITLAHLRPNLYTIGHPGTPIHCIIAVVAWVVHLFRPGLSLWDDVVQHPEIYIKASLYIANCINAFFLFLVGKMVFRYTGEIITAVVLQLTPFAFLMTLEVSYRLMPELIMLSIISAWIILLVKLLYQPEHQRNFNRYAILFGILFGFSLADKLTFAPFFFIPFFILPLWKVKLKYVLVSAVSFFLFAFPVLFSFSRFFDWVTTISSHKGVYGQGDKGFIDPVTFLNNLKVMLHSTYQILIPLALLAVSITIYAFKKRKADIVVTLGAGLIVLYASMYIITAKHYAFYYLTPGLHMTIFTGFLALFVIKEINRSILIKKMVAGILIIFGLILVINVAPKSQRQLKDLWATSRLCDASYRELAPLISKYPKIVCPYYYGCSSIEYSLTFGLQESGRYGRNILNDIVNKNYPSTFMFYEWNGHFYNGPFDLRPSEFIEPHVEYTLYVADYSDEKLNKFLTALQSDTLKFRYQINEIYSIESTREKVYMLRILDKFDASSGATNASTYD